MEVVLDTSVIIGYLRNHDPEAGLVVRLLEGHRLYVTAITVFELDVGFDEGSGQRDAVQSLLDAASVLPLDAPAAERASIEERRLRGKGGRVGTADVLIAGICLYHQKRLLTLNRQHFDRIPELDVFSPDELHL